MEGADIMLLQVPLTRTGVDMYFVNQNVAMGSLFCKENKDGVVFALIICGGKYYWSNLTDCGFRGDDTSGYANLEIALNGGIENGDCAIWLARNQGEFFEWAREKKIQERERARIGRIK